MNVDDTIVALSSGVAAARRSVVRVSGALTRPILERLLLTEVPNWSNARCFESAISFASAASSPSDACKSLDLEVTCYLWPDGRSFTGEPCAEIHLLGSLPLVEILIEKVQQLGARPADRGEFTLRSFLAGKLDLTQAEAVLGVIEAQDDAQLQRALEQLAGNLSRPVKKLRDQLIELIAHLEAGLDFVEEDIEFISTEGLIIQLQEIDERLGQISEQLCSRTSRTKLPSVVLVGPPNAGKSTLFNGLLEEQRAIVSKQAGTTRDAVSAPLKLSGAIIELVDTAGMEELSEATPRALAQSVLQSRLISADLILFCNSDTSVAAQGWLADRIKLIPKSKPQILVGTKADQARWDKAEVHVSENDPPSLQALKELIQQRLSDSNQNLTTDGMHDALVRSRNAIDLARVDLQRAMDNAQSEIGEELVAAELRFALDHLSRMIGEVHSEDILSNIFSRFCIGK